MLIVVCVLSPAQLHVEHDLSFTAFRLRFVGVLRGQFVQRTWFDRVPAGTVLAGTQLFRTRSDYKKWCVPRTYYEKMFPVGTVPRTSVNTRFVNLTQTVLFTHTKIIIYIWKPPTDFQLISELVNSGHCKMQIITTCTWLLVSQQVFKRCF